MEKKITSAIEVEKGKNFFKQMIEDKQKIRAYIQKHGTLNGFNRETINFVKPL